MGSLFSVVLSMPYAAHVSNCSLLISPSLFSFVLSLPYAAHVSNCSLLIYPSLSKLNKKGEINNEQLETWAA
jgi:hypothetical protein